MKPIYYIINSDEVLGQVYIVDDKEIVFMRSSSIDLEKGLKFIDPLGKELNKESLRNVLLSFLK